ncbi:uncharacterized protein Z520_00838 [Fonsecaea multimorphosa CBS 102226]|uniref:D-xylose reductase [NAD(P)H] n=1 Tax=Fonsecaea multimorphosa CBS 102226 TaxID=1442371 RepID=A0A0D2HQK7_9EURO|nr:uncharacterized protein Z520_00838 [Fonsecaea multimorphosa CBS 102226]KIY04146.1 hypothetical protein Z520_00838 [Fonsecaea multimorphosa CBS 102226]OAL31976.1 hypothetical protein AYO22_00846 [Fonsecaea multimorphosa]
MVDVRFRLNTGAEIPALGFGTWQAERGKVREAVEHAIKAGYRHIDCAYAYGNEREVGEGIRAGIEAAGIKRSDLFVTTKLWCTYHTRVEHALDKSLNLLGLDYVDLYLMHWPLVMNPNGNHDTIPRLPDGRRDLLTDWTHVQTYQKMEQLLPHGKVKAIGVANYSVKFLEELLPQINITPAVNQIENHPLLPQRDVVEFCKMNNIHVTAYSPLGSTGSPLTQEQCVVKIASETDATPASVLLSYHTQRGLSVLAKSLTLSRIEENMKAVKLTKDQMDELDALSSACVKRFVYPDFGVDFGFPDKSQ